MMKATLLTIISFIKPKQHNSQKDKTPSHQKMPKTQAIQKIDRTSITFDAN